MSHSDEDGADLALDAIVRAIRARLLDAEHSTRPIALASGEGVLVVVQSVRWSISRMGLARYAGHQSPCPSRPASEYGRYGTHGDRRNPQGPGVGYYAHPKTFFSRSNRSSGALWRVSWRTSPARAWQWPLVEWLRAGNSYAARCPPVVAKTYSEVHAAMALILAGRVGWFSRPQRVDCLGVLPVPTSGDCRLGVALAFLRIPSLRCVSGDDSYGWRNSTGAGCSDVAQPALPRPCGGNAAHAG